MPTRHAAMCSEHPIPDGRKEKDVDEVRIEEDAAALEQDASRLLHGAAIAVLAAVGDGIEGIGNGDDARGEGDAASLEAARIAGAVPALVMGEDTLLQVGIETGEGLEHVGATARVGGDGATLGGGETLDVVNDVEERLVDLADVVEEGDPGDAATCSAGEAGGVGEDECVLGDSADVDAGIRIVGVDGAKQRFEGGGGHAFGRPSCMELAPDEGGADCGGSTGSGDGNGGESHRWRARQETGGR